MKYRLYRTLYNTFARQTKVVGYCQKHKVSLTVRQIKNKGCIDKHCDFYRKVTNTND